MGIVKPQKFAILAIDKFRLIKNKFLICLVMTGQPFGKFCLISFEPGIAENPWSMLGPCLTHAWPMLGNVCPSSANSWPMLGMNSHTRDLGTNSLRFLYRWLHLKRTRLNTI